MTTTVEVIYEKGILRLAHAIPLEEGTRVEVTVNTPGPILLTGTPAEILDAIAALPLEGDGQEFSGRDHDKILYGEAGAR